MDEEKYIDSPGTSPSTSPSTSERANPLAKPGLVDGVQRRMESRHIQMIALAGTMGTGLFLSSGLAIGMGGPAGALLAWILVGTVTYSMMVSLGEMAVHAPISGGFITFAGRWLHPSIGFALGWQVIYHSAIGNPTELVATTILISYWDVNPSHQGAYITVLIAACVLINMFGVRVFAEAEYIFAMIKIALIVGLIIGGLIVNLGGSPTGDTIGFRYWNNPGAFVPYLYSGSLGHFLGFFSCLKIAAFSFVGMEGISLAAAEVKSPRTAISRAIRLVFIRIATFYILGILIIGMLVPSNHPRLLKQTGTAASSPFVLAFSDAGIKVLPSIVNAGITTSAFSSANSSLFAGSRALYSLSLRGHAPSFISRTTSKGVPFIALGIISTFLSLAYMTLSDGAATVFTWLLNIVTLSAFIAWTVICLTYLRFRRACQLQRVNLTHYKHWGQPYLAYWGLGWCLVIILCNGWKVFTEGRWDTAYFVTCYLNILLFGVLALGHWVLVRPQVPRLESMDLDSGVEEEEGVVKARGWGRVVRALVG